MTDRSPSREPADDRLGVDRVEDDATEEDALEDDATEEDALSWEGDEQFGRARDSRVRAAADEAEPGLGDDADTGAEEALSDGFSVDPPGTPASTAGRSAATVGFGVVYLALTIGWVFSVQLSAVPAGTSLGVALLGGFSNFLSLVAAPVWFAGVMQLTADAALRYRLGWLALGAGLLLPWPVLLGLVIR